MKLAYELCKTEAEILAMDPDEYARWVVFFQILADEDKRSKSKSRSRRNRRSVG